MGIGNSCSIKQIFLPVSDGVLHMSLLLREECFVYKGIYSTSCMVFRNKVMTDGRTMGFVSLVINKKKLIKNLQF